MEDIKEEAEPTLARQDVRSCWFCCGVRLAPWRSISREPSGDLTRFSRRARAPGEERTVEIIGLSYSGLFTRSLSKTLLPVYARAPAQTALVRSSLFDGVPYVFRFRIYILCQQKDSNADVTYTVSLLYVYGYCYTCATCVLTGGE